MPPLFSLCTFHQFASSTFHSNTTLIAVIPLLQLSTVLLRSIVHESACPLAGLVPGMHVATEKKWTIIFPQGPLVLEITVSVGLLVFSLSFFHIDCLLKRNIVCGSSKFTDKPDCLYAFLGVLTFISAAYTLAAFFFFLSAMIHQYYMRSSTTFLLKSQSKTILWQI